MSWFRKLLVITAVALLCLVGMQLPSGAAGYNANRAVAWALSHSQGKQPDFDGCTWFVSQALWAGGLKQTNLWNSKGHRGTVKKVPGTASATVAQELFGYLTYFQTGAPLSIGDRLDPTKSAVPEARPGDVIAYDWHGDDNIDHFAIVVSMGKHNYPNVADWGNAANGRSPYRMHGWSWSENGGQWIYKIHRNAEAYLFSIR